MKTTTLVSLLTAATLMVGCGGGSSSSDAGDGTTQTSGYSTWNYVTTNALAKQGHYRENRYSPPLETKDPSKYLESAVYVFDADYDVISEADHIGYREGSNVDDTYMLTKKEESVEFRNIVSIEYHQVLYFMPEESSYNSPAHNFPRVVSVGDTFDTFDRKEFLNTDNTNQWKEFKGECTLKEHNDNYKGKGEALVFECVSHRWDQAELSTDPKDADFTVDNTYVFIKGMGLYEIDELEYSISMFSSYITTFENK